MVEAEDGTLQAPDEGDIEVPTSQQTLGTKLKSSNLSGGEINANVVCDSNVGSILS